MIINNLPLQRSEHVKKHTKNTIRIVSTLLALLVGIDRTWNESQSD